MYNIHNVTDLLENVGNRSVILVHASHSNIAGSTQLADYNWRIKARRNIHMPANICAHKHISTHTDTHIHIHICTFTYA